jgi:hypothetical protein
MKIEVKYNIDFGKALKEVEEKKLSKTLNENLSHKVAETSSRYILEGKVKPKLSKNNPRGQKAPPLFDTGKLANSLKGSSKGITGINYAKEHREPDGYKWFKEGVDSKGFGRGSYLDVPQREFIVAKSEGKLLLRGTSGLVDKIYKEFEKKFINLLNKRIRKK